MTKKLINKNGVAFGWHLSNESWGVLPPIRCFLLVSDWGLYNYICRQLQLQDIMQKLEPIWYWNLQKMLESSNLAETTRNMCTIPKKSPVNAPWVNRNIRHFVQIGKNSQAEKKFLQKGAYLGLFIEKILCWSVFNKQP